jgi:hypothetical protein
MWDDKNSSLSLSKLCETAKSSGTRVVDVKYDNRFVALPTLAELVTLACHSWTIARRVDLFVKRLTVNMSRICIVVGKMLDDSYYSCCLPITTRRLRPLGRMFGEVHSCLCGLDSWFHPVLSPCSFWMRVSCTNRFCMSHSYQGHHQLPESSHIDRWSIFLIAMSFQVRLDRLVRPGSSLSVHPRNLTRWLLAPPSDGNVNRYLSDLSDIIVPHWYTVSFPAAWPSCKIDEQMYSYSSPKKRQSEHPLHTVTVNLIRSWKAMWTAVFMILWSTGWPMAWVKICEPLMVSEIC